MQHTIVAIIAETKLIGRKEILFKHMSGTILDVGCGEGEVLVKASLLGYDIIGIDRSADEVKKAKKLAKLSNVGILVECASTEDMPFQKESFDTIILGEVLEHTMQPGLLIENMLQYLKPNGKLLITTPCGLSHMDADHKSFFFTKKNIELMNKYWMFDFLPSMWMKVHQMINIDELLSSIKCTRYEVDEIDYNESKHPSLDFFIIIYK